MTEKFFCPTSIADGGGPNSPFKAPFNGEAHWIEGDGTCSYCGSLHPDVFMARLEAGDVTIVPTDKGYKAYLRNKGGAAFRQTYRHCPEDAKCTGPADCSHWTTREIDQAKFYYQHLSADQCRRFVELLNAKRMTIAHPGHFYVLPFFCSVG